MGDFLLSERQMAWISPHFPLSHGLCMSMTGALGAASSTYAKRPPVEGRAGWLRAAQDALRAVHPVEPKPQIPHAYDTALYCQRHKVENLFAKLKVATHRNMPQSTCPQLLVGHLYRSRRHLLALNEPEPRL